jgi:hypothetical protein
MEVLWEDISDIPGRKQKSMLSLGEFIALQKRDIPEVKPQDKDYFL